MNGKFEPLAVIPESILGRPADIQVNQPLEPIAGWQRQGREGKPTFAFARWCDLLLKATRAVTIALVSSRERKQRQPGLATDGPKFVGWHQLVRGIQGS